MAEAQARSGAEKYIVRAHGGGWRIVSAAGASETFSRSSDAVEQACRTARENARQGRLSVVVAETMPEELHCFMPRPVASTAPTPMPGYLRLIVPDA